MTETRTQLLEATCRCIAEKGLTGATSRRIASSAGANLAAITYHFGSKDQLVSEALLGALHTWLEPTLQVLRGGGDPSARMLVAIQTLTTTFAAHRDEASIYLEALMHARRSPLLQAGLAELLTELRAIVTSHVRAMQARGQLAGWVDPEAMASLLVGVAHGLVTQVSIDPDGPGIDIMAGQFGALLLAARADTS